MRDRPNAPTAEVASEDEITILYFDLAERGTVKTRVPTENLDVWTFVVDVARLAGFIASKLQPLPGNIRIWQGHGHLKTYVHIYQMLRNNDMLKDSTMGGGRSPLQPVGLRHLHDLGGLR